MKLLLRACAETGRAIANEDLLARVLLLGEVVEGHCPESHRIAKQSLLAQSMNKGRGFRRAGLVGGIDHAFEDIFFDAFAKGEMTEVLGHAESFTDE